MQFFCEFFDLLLTMCYFFVDLFSMEVLFRVEEHSISEFFEVFWIFFYFILKIGEVICVFLTDIEHLDLELSKLLLQGLNFFILLLFLFEFGYFFLV